MILTNYRKKKQSIRNTLQNNKPHNPFLHSKIKYDFNFKKQNVKLKGSIIYFRYLLSNTSKIFVQSLEHKN